MFSAEAQDAMYEQYCYKMDLLAHIRMLVQVTVASDEHWIIYVVDECKLRTYTNLPMDLDMRRAWAQVLYDELQRIPYMHTHFAIQMAMTRLY